MELSVLKPKGSGVEQITVSELVFGRKFNEPLVHQVVNGYMANARQATRAQKNRSQINKSTKKPWRQKGTGQARAGMASSPIWRGGGRAFPASVKENFTQKINRKMYRAGMQSIFSGLVKEDRLQVIEDIEIDEPKTKKFVTWLESLGQKSALIVCHDISENLFLASRNIQETLVILPHEIDPYSLIRYPKVLITKKALAQIEEQYK